MIELVTGDLLKADTDALVNTVNTVGVMGKGMALQFKQAFPANYDAYRRACQRGEVVIGRMFVFDAGQLVRPRFIINFPTKGHWKSRSQLEDIEAGLADLVRVLRQLDIRSVAVPPLGCGNGGLNWSDVRPRIEEAFRRSENIAVLLFTPSGSPAPSEMNVATEKPRMTVGRAALLGLLQRYTQPSLGVSVLEIQKLLYLLQASGEPLRLNFGKGAYGPYAENLNHVLQALEGHYIRGYGDRSQKVSQAAPIELIPDAAEEAVHYLADYPSTRQRFDRVTALIDGFESPYGLELLSTVHWLAVEVDQVVRNDVGLAVRQVQAWSRRKNELFTDRHIRIAWQRLREHGWLEPNSTTQDRSDSAGRSVGDTRRMGR